MGQVSSYSYGQPFGGHIPRGTSVLFIALALHASRHGLRQPLMRRICRADVVDEACPYS